MNQKQKQPQAMSIEALCSLPSVYIGSTIEHLGNGRIRLYFFSNAHEYYCDLPLAYKNFYGNATVRVVPSTNPLKEGTYAFRYLYGMSLVVEGFGNWHVELDRFLDETNGVASWVAGVYETRNPMLDYPTAPLPFIEFEAGEHERAEVQRMAEEWGKANLGEKDIWSVIVKGTVEQYKGTDVTLAQIEYIKAAIAARTAMPYVPAPRLFKNGVEVVKRKPVTTVVNLIHLEKQQKQAGATC